MDKNPTSLHPHQNRGVVPAVAVLVLVTCAAFFGALRNGFVMYDDQNYVLDNPMVQSGIGFEGIAWAFTTFHTGNWHPVTWISHMMDAELYGLNPVGHHATNLIIHVVNVVLLFWIAKRATGTVVLGAIVAAIFAVHPLRVESVAWISERKDVLSTLFAFAAILAYFQYVDRQSTVAYWCVPLGMALSLLTKPMMVSLPIILLLLDIWPLKRISLPPASRETSGLTNHRIGLGRLVLEKIPLVILSAASCLITFVAQNQGGTVAQLQVLPLVDRLVNAGVSYVRYLAKAFWPLDLAVLYPYPLQWPAWHAVGATVLLTAVTVGAIATARRRPYLLVGWSWFVIALLPVIGIVQVGAQSMADRYSYFPLIGITLAIVCGVNSLLRSKVERVVALSVLTVVILGFALLTSLQTRVWRDTPTLFLHAVRVTDDNVIMMDLLAETLAEQYPHEDPLTRLEQSAMTQPIDATIYFSLAESFLKRGDMTTPIQCYERVISLAPNHAQAHNNLAWLLATHPQAQQRNGARAVELATRASLLSQERDAGALDTLAAAFAENGRFFEAVQTAQRARELAFAAGQSDLVEIIDHHLLMFGASRPVRIAEAPQTQPR